MDFIQLQHDSNGVQDIDQQENEEYIRLQANLITIPDSGVLKTQFFKDLLCCFFADDIGNFGKVVDSQNFYLKKTEWRCNNCYQMHIESNLDLDDFNTITANPRESSHGKLSGHIFSCHKDWKTTYYRFKHNKVSVFSKVSPKAKIIYAHLDFMISNNLPFSYVQKMSYRMYMNILPISRKTLMKYTDALCNEVCEYIKTELPNQFGIMLDGWESCDSTYYIGVYAIYMINGVKKRPLLQLSPVTLETEHTLIR